MSDSTASHQILQLGHPLLKTRASPVNIPVDAEIRSLIGELMQLMARENGVGIAAPQIGRSQQVMIIASKPNLRYPHAPHMLPLPMLNPQILSYSSQMEDGWEGCLSVPDLRGNIRRAQSVDVRYHDLNSHFHSKKFEGFVARIIQHEYDHLMGKVFLDHIQSADQLVSEQEYLRHVL